MRTVKDPDVRRQEIIAAAEELFLEKTYEKTTTGDVMRKLGIAKGTIYHYFPSKEHLLDAVVEHMADSYLARRLPAVEACNGSALDRIRILFDRGSRSADETAATEQLHETGNLALHTRLLAALVERLAPVFAAEIRAGCAAGLFRTEHPLEVAELLLAGIQFLTDDGVHAWSPEDCRRRLQAVPTLVETLLAAPPDSFAFLDPDADQHRQG